MSWMYGLSERSRRGNAADDTAARTQLEPVSDKQPHISRRLHA